MSPRPIAVLGLALAGCLDLGLGGASPSGSGYGGGGGGPSLSTDWTDEPPRATVLEYEPLERDSLIDPVDPFPAIGSQCRPGDPWLTGSRPWIRIDTERGTTVESSDASVLEIRGVGRGAVTGIFTQRNGERLSVVSELIGAGSADLIIRRPSHPEPLAVASVTVVDPGSIELGVVTQISRPDGATHPAQVDEASFDRIPLLRGRCALHGIVTARSTAT